MATIPYEYYVSVNEGSNTSESISRNELHADVYVNPIVPSAEPDEGYVLWGQRTLEAGNGTWDRINNSILQYIAEVQPINISASEIFRLNFKYTGYKKKLNLRLPDELFEME